MFRRKSDTSIVTSDLENTKPLTIKLNDNVLTFRYYYITITILLLLYYYHYYCYHDCYY